MSSPSPIQGVWSIVTGASSGIGQDLARELAARGANVILAARRLDPLRRLAQELSERHSVQAEAIEADLLRDEDRRRLFDLATADGRSIGVLVNNAGFGLYGEFRERSWEEIERLIDLDIKALTHLTHLFAAPMIERRSGYFLHLGSIGSFQASPRYAAYSAAKAYVLSFSEAIHFEMRPHGVSSTALCPGVTRSEFLQVAGQSPNWFQKATIMASADVARAGVNAMLKRKALIVPGLSNKIAIFGNRLLPRSWVVRTAANLMK